MYAGKFYYMIIFWKLVTFPNFVFRMAWKCSKVNLKISLTFFLFRICLTTWVGVADTFSGWLLNLWEHGHVTYTWNSFYLADSHTSMHRIIKSTTHTHYSIFNLKSNKEEGQVWRYVYRQGAWITSQPSWYQH